MMNVLMLLAGLILPRTDAVTAQVQPCVWPNTCARETVVQVQPCVWPNPCVKPEIWQEAQVTTCQWPNTCASAEG